VDFQVGSYGGFTLDFDFPLLFSLPLRGVSSSSSSGISSLPLSVVKGHWGVSTCVCGAVSSIALGMAGDLLCVAIVGV
jgi:hypothetical protein